MNAVTNRYLSRGHNKAALIERTDPVVYSNNPDKSPVTYELIEEYAENGFVILNDLFSSSEVDSLQNEIIRLRDDTAACIKDETITEPGSGEVRSIFKIHTTSLVFRKLSADRRLANLARYILNDDIYIHQSRLNFKPGFRGKEFYWHSDFETWHMEDGMPGMRALSMSITLDENLVHNGSLMLIPGSHMEYVVCPGETPVDHYKQSLKKQEYGVPTDECLTELVDRHGISIATGRPGSVVLFDCNIMHGSNGNITPHPRSNVFFVYNAISNRLQNPFSGQAPRPEFIASRNNIETIPVDITSK